MNIQLIAVGAITLVIGYFARKLMAESRFKKAEAEARSIIDEAKKEADSRRREIKFELKDQLYKMRQDFDKETKDRQDAIAQLELKSKTREGNMERKLEILDKKEREIQQRDKNLVEREAKGQRKSEELDRILTEERSKLQKISGLTVEEAKKLLMSRIETEVKFEAAGMIKRVEDEARLEADKRAKNVIAEAMQRCAADHTVETTVSVVHLPGDEMKGRIIGREGRNIRALEVATGIDVIVDDTPEAVILSGFDIVRREIARISLERLIEDGRIHPARIEEVVAKVKKEMEIKIRDEGEKAILEIGVAGVHPEIVNYVGRLKYRTSYGQNVLQHSKEVAYLMSNIAAEMGYDPVIAKRIGLLHDIGKAISHEVEGSHAKLGADLARKFGESQEVVHAIEAHHQDVRAATIYAILVQVGDAISASRPGARRETLESYIKRLEQLESIADGFKGVDKAFAIQAGREIRVIVKPDQIKDEAAIVLARDISKKVEEGMEYPGQIKVTVIRETRAVEYAK